MLGAGLLDGRRTLENEAGTQVLGTDILVVCQFLRRAGLENRTFVKKIGPVNDSHRFTDIVVSNDDADILVLELRNNILDILHRNRIDTGKRLIQKDELRVNGKGTGNLATAALAT